MKNILILFCSGILAVLINMPLSGQNSILVLKKKTNGKEFHIQQGTNLEIFVKTGNILMANLKSSIMIVSGVLLINMVKVYKFHWMILQKLKQTPQSLICLGKY